VAEKNGLLQIGFSGAPEELLGLREAEDLFRIIAQPFDLPRSPEALRRLERAARDAPFDSTPRIPGLAARRPHSGRLFRVVARQVGRAPYRRDEIAQAVVRGILARKDGPWRPVATGGIEFWVTAWAADAFIAVRLTDSSARHREYKRAHLPASLRPSAAATLVGLTNPAPDDVFLDPMCGAGTLLIERGEAGRYALLLGGDLSVEAVDAARANIGRRYQPIELHTWDARALPLDRGSVTALATNLPFGTRVGDAETNRRLYAPFIREAARVLRPRARLVTLTGDTVTLDAALRGRNEFVRLEHHFVQVLGHPARIDLFERR
jgi:23S rRNA G2445 N2-methylase RlmL